MLIKLTGNRTGAPVLVDADAIIVAEELTDIYQNDRPYTRISLHTGAQVYQIGVEESIDEILEEIEGRAEL